MNICSNCKKEVKQKYGRKFCINCIDVTFDCEWCGKKTTIKRERYERSNHHFCSRSCGQRHMTKCAANARTKAAGGKAIVVCPNCGKTNIKKQSNKKRLFCDKSCYNEYRRNHPENYPSPKMSEKARKQMSKERTGSGNPMYGSTGHRCVHWKGGRRKDRGKGWTTIKKIIKRRDGHKCMLCGTKKAPQFDVHHIFNWADEKINHPHNLITLCANCHQSKIHGPEQLVPNHQLSSLAQQSTRASFLPDDLRLLAKLDWQQRDGKPVPTRVCKTLALPKNYPYHKKPYRQPELPLFSSPSHQP